MKSKFVASFEELSAQDTAIAGGKGASLGEMTKIGLPVPPGFVILSKAFDLCATKTGLQEIPANITAEIIKQFKKLGAKYVAVRSSATGEDSADAAWAGQLETYLNTTEENLLENVKKCWASLFLPRALAYRDGKGLNQKKIAVAVVVQKMVESEKSGIAFSVHPVTQDKNQLIIEAIFGLGEAIVSGAANPDSYVLSKEPRKIIDKKIQDKQQVLADAEIIDLSNYIIKLEKYYGFPVDVEWAKQNNKLYIIQCRPITTLKEQQAQIPVPTKKELWYVKKLYQKYQQKIDRFNYPCLVFYACLTWFWVTDQAKKYFGATIPFFFFFIKAGAGTLETPWYLGPGEKVMKDLEKERQAWLIKNQRLLDEAEKIFFSWLKDNPVRAGQSLDNYLELLHQTVQNLLFNHIHFQIATQIDKPLNQKILGLFQAAGHALSENELIDLSVSDRETEVVVHDKNLTDLALWCKKNNLNVEEKSFELNLKDQTFKDELQACYNSGYFLRSGYGGVVLWTLKDEYLLLAAADGLGRKKSKATTVEAGALNEEQQFYLAAARHFSAARDRRKSLQQRAFYRLAEILEEIGKIIMVPRTNLECLRFEEFTKEFLTSQQVKQLITQRQAGYFGFWSPETGTWEWNGEEAANNYQQIAQKYQAVRELKGNCACPGWARGKVRIVLNPRLQEKFTDGEILVAGMTSPDYVPLMKKAAAIVTELGGITCHAAIISRELNIPCVIGTNIATKVLKDGDLVEVDADQGVVRVLQ